MTRQLTGIAGLLQVMAKLRDPEHGCPWDKAQTMSSLIPYTIEEAYEVAAAITAGDWDEIKGELGDLLFQVVFYAQLANEQQRFDFDAIAQQMTDKLIRRHPHVFGDKQADDAAAVKAQWEQIKAVERANNGVTESVFDGVPNSLPSLLLALKLQQRAATVGFDWPSLHPVLAKVREEIDEVQAELERAEPDADAIAEELGDLLFAVVNLARHAQIHPEDALRRANQKFKQRFQMIEQRLRERHLSVNQLALNELEEEWSAVKQESN